MQFLNTMSNVIGYLSLGVGLTKFCHLCGNKIEVAESPPNHKILRLFIGVLAPSIIIRTAEKIVLDKNERLFFKIGVSAESILGGAKLGIEGAQTEQFKGFGELVGKIAVFVGCYFFDDYRVAQVGFFNILCDCGAFTDRKFELLTSFETSDPHF
jgi:hypothetical protein